MAENKKSFLVYADWLNRFEKMPDEFAGKLFKHILQYVNDLDPETDDFALEMAFEPIKQQLKRDLKRWENIREKRSEAGKASAEARKNKSQHRSTKSTSVKSVEQTSTKSTVNVNVNVNDITTKDSYSLFLDFFNRQVGRRYRGDKKSKRQFNARLKEGYTGEDFKKAILNAKEDPHHKQSAYKWLTPEFITRNDKLEAFANMISPEEVERKKREEEIEKQRRNALQ